jgi:hypothetical protein
MNTDACCLLGESGLVVTAGWDKKEEVGWPMNRQDGF